MRNFFNTSRRVDRESETILGFVTAGIRGGFKMQQRNTYPLHVRPVGLTDPHRYDLLDVRKSNSSARG